MVYIFLLLSFSLQAMENTQEVTLGLYASPIKDQFSKQSSIFNDSRVSIDTSSSALVGAILFFKHFINSSSREGYAYGLETGVGKDYEPLQKWIKWQLTGQMDNLVKERDKCKAKGSRVGKREAITIEHIMQQELTRTLHIIANGTLEQAEGLVWELENPPLAQFEPSYYEIKKEELMLARRILGNRKDYCDKISRQQQNVSQEVKTQNSVPSQAESPKTLSTSSSVSSESQVAYDLKLTTPTDSDLIFRQRITASPEIDFREYLIQVHELQNDLKAKGLYTHQQIPLFIKEVAQGTAKHLAHVAQHPVQYTQRFVEANLELAKEAALFFVDVYSAPEELYTNERELQLYQEAAVRRGETLAQKYNELCEIIPQMNRSEWANLTSSIIVDGLMLHGAGKGIQLVKKGTLPTSLSKHPLFTKAHEAIERSLAQQVEVVTAEGVSFKTPQVFEEPNALQNGVEAALKRSPKPSIISAKEKVTILEDVQQTVSKLTEGQLIKGLRNSTTIEYYFEHIFSEQHIKDGLMNAGSRSEIIKGSLDAISKLDLAGKLKNGDNQIRMIMNSAEITIRLHVREGIMYSYDVMPGNCTRVIGNFIDLVNNSMQ